QVRDIAAVDVENDERDVIGAALLRHRSAEEHAGTVERDERMRALRHRRLQSLCAFRIADAGGAAWGWPARNRLDDRSFLGHRLFLLQRRTTRGTPPPNSVQRFAG